MVNWSGLNFVVAQTLDVLVNCCPAADQVLKWNLSYWSPVNGVSFPTLFTKWEIGERDFLSMLSRLPSKLFTLEWPAGPISSQWRTSLMGEKRSSAISWSEVISRSSRHLNLARTSLKAEPVFTRRLSFFFHFQDEWVVTIVQLIALFYKDQHVENMQKLLGTWINATTSESSEDDDESNTSPPVKISTLTIRLIGANLI